MSLNIKKNIPLSTLTTMRLGGPAHELVAVSTVEELREALRYAASTDQPVFVLGGGSNVIARDEGFDGLLIKNEIKGFEVVSEDENFMTVKIGAGENWDKMVEKTVELGLSGIEAMSAIPGTTGATPVQNVGAYGQEIADTLVSVETIDTQTTETKTFSNADCQFSYRNSIFKNPATRHNIITSVILKLSKMPMQPPFYASLTSYLDTHHIDEITPSVIREAVIVIRRTKLPDPRLIANTGSFFKNPIVDKATAVRLQATHGDMPSFPLSDGSVKLAAGWLIESAGLKGYASHGFTTYDHNALVVVNESAKDYASIRAFTQEIIDLVHAKFGVTLEQEPETLENLG